MDQWTDGPTDQPTKPGVESRSIRLKSVKNDRGRINTVIQEDKKKNQWTDQWMDQRTDGPTERQTKPDVESRSIRLKIVKNDRCKMKTVIQEDKGK